MVLKPIRIQGEIVQPGRVFRTQNYQELINRGYVRHLSKDEKKDILDSYVIFARKVFSIKGLAQNKIIHW